MSEAARFSTPNTPGTLGTIVAECPNFTYKVKLESGHTILAHTTTALRQRMVRLLPGDRVQVNPSPYDASRGRITHKL